MISLISRLAGSFREVEVGPRYVMIDEHDGSTIYSVLAIDYPQRRVLVRSKRYGITELERLPAHWGWVMNWSAQRDLNARTGE